MTRELSVRRHTERYAGKLLTMRDRCENRDLSFMGEMEKLVDLWLANIAAIETDQSKEPKAEKHK